LSLAATCNGATLVILEQSLQNGVAVEVPFSLESQDIGLNQDRENYDSSWCTIYLQRYGPDSCQCSSRFIHVEAMLFCWKLLDKNVFDKFLHQFRVPVRQLYGCTEAGAICINLDENTKETWDSVGAPLKNVEVKIVDEHEVELGVGTSGEIVIKSQTITTGYNNLPELNQEVFKDGAFFTGDLGKIDQAGRVYIIGRKKILIDTGDAKLTH
jgi:long-chain acyl-CoA synthetase